MIELNRETEKNMETVRKEHENENISKDICKR